MEFIDLKAQYAALRASIDARIQSVLDHGQYIMGPEVKELEDRLSTYTGAAHCITVASGTDALLVALMALGVGPGDEVITTPFSFIATAEVIVLLGATPVFVDIEADTCHINAALIEASITPRTRAIIPVSLFGQVADMDRINAIAAEHDIAVIEDAAQSFGALYHGRRSCNLSTIACTSFFPSKPLGCYGDGGAIFTGDAGLAQAMREIRVHGQSRRYVHTRIGLGARMDTLQCAIVLAKLERFDWELGQRQRLGSHYNALFAGSVDTVAQRPGRSNVFAQYTVMLAQRDQIAEHLKAAGIPTAIHYPVPMHLQAAYANVCRADSCLIAEAVAGKVLSLPMGPDMDMETAATVAHTLMALAPKAQASARATAAA